MIKKIASFWTLLVITTTTTTYSQSHWVKVSEKLVFVNAPFNNCHASTLVETKTGELLLACFGGSQEGKNDVVIWSGYISTDGLVKPKEVANGIVNENNRFPCWNPVFFKKRNGQLVLFYKVGPNPREWWGMYKTSDNDGKTWSTSVKLPAGILGPIKNKAIELKNGKVLCPSSKEYADGHWRVFIEQTNEKLKKWNVMPVDTDSAFDVIQPSIISYGGKNLQILCRSKQGNVVQARSNDNGKTWSQLSKTTLQNPNSGTDAVTLKDGRQLIVYNPDVPGKDWWNGRTKLRVAMSTDGEHWQDIIELEQGMKEEFSYPAIIQSTDGLIHITYTYDRKNIKHVVLQENKES